MWHSSWPMVHAQCLELGRGWGGGQRVSCEAVLLVVQDPKSLLNIPPLAR